MDHALPGTVTPDDETLGTEDKEIGAYSGPGSGCPDPEGAGDSTKMRLYQEFLLTLSRPMKFLLTELS